MAEIALVERLKLRIDEIELSDSKLSEIIDDVTIEVLANTNQTILNAQLESAVISLSVVAVNRIGTEGIASESYSGVSTSYLENISPGVASILNANRRVGLWEVEDESTS